MCLDNDNELDKKEKWFYLEVKELQSEGLSNVYVIVEVKHVRLSLSGINYIR